MVSFEFVLLFPDSLLTRNQSITVNASRASHPIVLTDMNTTNTSLSTEACNDNNYFKASLEVSL
jgi:hypothetical protein